MRSDWKAISLAASTAWCVFGLAGGAEFPERWNYIRCNLGGTNDGPLIEQLKLSKQCGCTHILLTEGRMARLSEKQPDAYYARVTNALAVARELDLKLIPVVFPIGYGGKYLYFDGNLMAGLPVRDMPFIVKGTTAQPDSAAGLPLANPGFEQADGDRALGWAGQKFAGTNSFIDRKVRHSGQQSLRFGNLDKPAVRGASSASVIQTLKVRPFQYYRIEFWGKWDGKYPGGPLHIVSDKHDRILNRTEDWFEKPGPDGWSRFEVYFNTLDSETVTISLTHIIQPGYFWIDDVKAEPAGLMLIVRRANTPLTVTSEDGKTVYKEGEDFKPVFDPQLSEKPFGGEIDHTHKSATIELTTGSRIRDGQRLLVSFYHTMRIGADQDVISIQEPRLLELMDNEIRGVAKYWPSTGYMMNYDEIRMGGWEPNPNGEKLTPGQILARHARKGYDLIRKYDSKAQVHVWSDMFTPYHNARPISVNGPYWMANGNWDGAWEGLPKDVIVLNWYAPSLPSFRFFADRGYRQVMCGYYDVATSEDMKTNIHKWMTVSRDIPNVLGFMYTTWKNRYTPMPDYFRLVDTYDKWSGAMPSPKLDTKTVPVDAPAGSTP